MIGLLATSPVWTSPILVGLVIGIPTTAFGFAAYRRAEKLDKAAAQAAIVATQGDAVQRVIDGLDRMVDNLQADNKEVRAAAADLSRRLNECNAAYTELKRLTNGGEGPAPKPSP